MSDRVLGALLFFLGVFNWLDYFFTVRALSWGIEEANPFMVSALEANDWMFPFVKLALVPAGLLLVWLFRHRIAKARMIVMVSLWAVCLSYAGVTAWHIYGQYFS